MDTLLPDNRYIKGSLSIIQEFYIEFFGTLIPGIVAVATSFVLGIGFYYCFTDDMYFVRAASEVVFKSFGGVILFLSISYMIGAISYRRNPKTPDVISAYRQWCATSHGASAEEIGRLSVMFNRDIVSKRGVLGWFWYRFNRADWILKHAGGNIDYPYPHMRRYLLCRGLAHLADYVPWCAGIGRRQKDIAFEKGVCSKNYVNIIKQCIRNSGRGNLMLDMLRNECHIRMLNSFWYILAFIQRMVSLAFVLVPVFVAFKVFVIGYPETAGFAPDRVVSSFDWHRFPFVNGILNCFPISLMETRLGVVIPTAATDLFVRCCWLLFLLAVAFALVKYCRNSIELGFHYVRTREVVMILQSAWILDNVENGGDAVRLRGVRSIFDDIRADAGRFEESICATCKDCKKCRISRKE